MLHAEREILQTKVEDLEKQRDRVTDDLESLQRRAERVKSESVVASRSQEHAAADPERHPSSPPPIAANGVSDCLSVCLYFTCAGY